jgi:hypothetical protein
VNAYTFVLGSRFAQEIKNRPRSHHVLCQETVGQVRNWLTTCHSSHHCPYRASDPKLPPSRLIKIRAEGGQFHPILYETKGASDLCWCALSYCWGGDQLIKTTKATYNRYLAGLRFDDLPRTLQDAIRVTNCLGAEFLWIDCLCIIQDDENDIANELAQMPEIYRNAWLTIIASTAATCYDGFLQDRELFSPGSSPFLCSMLYTSRHGEVGPAMVTESADSSSLEPIDARAWTLQEGRLSPRIIEFAQGQLRWRCLSDSGYDGDYPGKNDRHDMYTARNFISHRDPQLQDPETFTKTWANVVENYTGRRLSVYTDKLPAISAVAQEFAHVRGDRYIAGLWEAELPDSLLWSTIPHPPQSTTYIGPSWSWASANGITQLWSKRADNVVGAQSLKTLKFVAIIRTCNVQPVHPNAPFGAVKSGILVIEGYIKRGFWFYRHKGRVVQSIPDTKGTKIRGGIGSGDVDSGALVENDHPEANLTMTVDCLKIADWSGGSAGLLLVQADASSITRYRRVGLLDSNGTSDQRFWDDAQWTKVEIV